MKTHHEPNNAFMGGFFNEITTPPRDGITAKTEREIMQGKSRIMKKQAKKLGIKCIDVKVKQ